MTQQKLSWPLWRPCATPFCFSVGPLPRIARNILDFLTAFGPKIERAAIAFFSGAGFCRDFATQCGSSFCSKIQADLMPRGGSWESFWSHFGHQMAPKMQPKPKKAPKSVPGRFWSDFGTLLPGFAAPFLEHFFDFGHVFCVFFEVLFYGRVLERIWCRN